MKEIAHKKKTTLSHGQSRLFENKIKKPAEKEVAGNGSTEINVYFRLKTKISLTVAQTVK